MSVPLQFTTIWCTLATAAHSKRDKVVDAAEVDVIGKNNICPIDFSSADSNTLIKPYASVTVTVSVFSAATVSSNDNAAIDKKKKVRCFIHSKLINCVEREKMDKEEITERFNN